MSSGGVKDRVLIVDDEPQVLVALEDILADEFIVLKADSGERALRLVETEGNVAVVVTDQRMPRMSGDELLAKLAGISDAARMLVTGFADLTAVIRAVNEGRIFAYVAKPWEADDFRLKVQRAADHFRLAQELAHERRLLRDLMDNTTDGIYFKDAELRFLRANGPLLGRLGTDASSIVGKRLRELVGVDADVDAAEREERRLVEGGAPVGEVTRALLFGGVQRWFSESKAPVRDAGGAIVGIVGISRDVTERKQSEERLARLTSVQSLMGSINAAIVRAQDREALLAECCRIAVAVGGIAHAAILEVDPESKVARVVAAEPPSSPVLRQVALELGAGARMSVMLAGAVDHKVPLIHDEVAVTSDARFQKLLLDHDLRSLALFPLQRAGRVEALFGLAAKQAGFFDSEEVKLLSDVSSNISLALDHIGKTTRLNFLAYHDGLTGLPNRDLFIDRVSQQLS
ncbi:MAG TPA: PAS domain-containing protein, partial [Polyangiaceae bacterium]|nr:PAS domain-containing protein [Polyangiaceae bacterium]